MATLEVRGYANQVTIKETAKGQMCKWTLGAKQKVFKDGAKVDDKLYVSCVSFDTEQFPNEGEYLGITGYVTITQSDKLNNKTGKPFLNVEVSVKNVERLAQLGDKSGGSIVAKKADAAPPSDPFAI